MSPIFGAGQKSLAELQDEEELLKQKNANKKQQVTLERQRYILSKLKEAGVQRSVFTTEHGFDWGAAMATVKGFFKSDDD